MKRFELHPAIKIPVVFVLLFLTAFFTPWWGTIVVVATLSFFIGISSRGIALLSFFGWMTACFARDLSNEMGPSRVFARLFQLERIGIESNTTYSQIVVYSVIGLIGCLLALLTAGFLRSVRSIFPSITLR